MLIDILQNLVEEKKKAGVPDFVIRNFLKEYLQYPVLEFISNNQEYKNFIFTGGSALRICYNAPRLSEDLDFDLAKKDFAKLRLQDLASKLKQYFTTNFLATPDIRIQGKVRIYLKFPVLKKLGLVTRAESDLLYVKIEVVPSIFTKPATEKTVISNFGFNFIINNYTLSFLFTGKIIALLTRQWFKGQNDTVDIKGRDFYDLYWYLEKGIRPDYRSLKKIINISTEQQLKKVLKERIKKNVTTQKLVYDLKNFLPQQSFVNDFCKNYPSIMAKLLK